MVLGDLGAPCDRLFFCPLRPDSAARNKDCGENSSTSPKMSYECYLTRAGWTKGICVAEALLYRFRNVSCLGASPKLILLPFGGEIYTSQRS